MAADRHEHIHKSKSQIFINNFIGGIAWGLGATIGVSLLLAALGFIASRAIVVPFIGSFISQIIDFVLKNNPRLNR